MEAEFLLTGYGLAVPSGRMEGPLLNSCNDGFVDAMAKAASHFDVGDFTCCVDDDVENDVALGTARELGNIRLGCGEVASPCDVDVAGAERVRSFGGVRVRSGRRVGVGRGWVGLELWSNRGWERCVGCGLFGLGFGIWRGGLDGGSAGHSR